MNVAGRPCANCPWRTDAPPGEFPPSRYEALEATHGRPGAEAPLDAPLFACHKTPDGAERPCAGWLATEGYDHLGVRLAVITGAVPGGALTAGPDWPELYPDYAAMAAANGWHPAGPRGETP